MRVNRGVLLKSILITIVGAFVMVYAVLKVHNDLVTNNQISNNHEKLELIEDKLEKSKTKQEEIVAVYDELYQSKVDSLAFQLRYITDIDLNETYAEEMREVYEIDYLCVKENNEIFVEAGTKLSDDENPRIYEAQIDDTKSILIELNNDALNANLESNASTKAVLENVTLGQSGFVLSFNSNGEIVFSPNEEDIGKKASLVGIDFSAFKDGKDTILTYNDIKYLSSCKKIDEGMVVTVVPYSEITANDFYTVVIALVIYVLLMSFIILYSTFLHEEVHNKEDEIENKKILNKKLFRIVILGSVFSFIVSFYLNTLFTLSEQSITNTNRLNELIASLSDNDETITRQTSEYTEQYSQKLDELAYVIENVDKSYLSREFMTELKNVLKVNSAMYFDLDGNVIAANTDNWSYSISKDPNEQSYEYWDILNGDRTKIIQDVQVNVNGNLRQYMAKAIQDDSYHTIGMVTLSATPEQLEKARINTDVESVLESISTGNRGFAFAITKDDEENSSFVYFPKENLIGKDPTIYGMKSNQLASEYNDFITIDETTYYCSSSTYGDMIVYIAVPFNSLNKTTLPISIIVAITVLVFMCMLWYLFTHREDIFKPIEEKAIEKDQMDIVMSNGRLAKTRTVGFRWSHEGVKWDSKTAGQKALYLMNLVFVIFASILMILVVFKDYFFEDDSLFRFILSTKWQKGLNLFSLTYCLLITICIIEISSIIRKLVMWVAHSLNAKGETICRLIDSFIKFGTVVGLLYYGLSIFGVDTSTLVTSAGILTLVVGLGAQSLVGDVLAGLFIVFESEFQVGDIITVGDFRGTVIEIGVRTTKVKEWTGNVKIFSNSDIKDVVNMTKDYSVIALDMSIEYGEDLRYVEKVLKDEFPNIKNCLPAIVDGPYYRGVSELGDNAVTITIITKCLEADRIQLERDLKRQLKLIFDKYNISIPFPQVVINNPIESKHEVSSKEIQQADNFVEKQKAEFKNTGIIE